MTMRTVRSKETGRYFAGGPPAHPQFTEHRGKAWESDGLSAAMIVTVALQRRGIDVDIVVDHVEDKPARHAITFFHDRAGYVGTRRVDGGEWVEITEAYPRAGDAEQAVRDWRADNE